MKRSLIQFFKNSRDKFYHLIRRPRVYYDENPFLGMYGLKKVDLSYYKKNSLTNKDFFEFLKNKINS